MRAPVVSLHRVSAAGAIEMVAANVPYSSLLWTRRNSTVGEFELSLACPMPVEWPGRYIVTAEGHDEAGVVEKADGSWGGSGEAVSLSGRFLESLWDRYAIAAGGQTARGANWRQAVTRALSSWHMGDVPPLALGEGTEAATGSSYGLAAEAGDSAMVAVYSCCADNGARPLVGYDRGADASRLSVRVVSGVDRTRAQDENPWCVFSVGLGSADQVAYSGDYSVACSEVMAHAEATRQVEGEDPEQVVVDRTVAVPGFDAAAQWRARAYENVTSLMGRDDEGGQVIPTAALVDQAGGLRALDHRAALAVDCDVAEAGYREWWDLGDLVDVEVPGLSLVASERVEEVRESYDASGFRLEATVGTKGLSRIARAVMGRR